MSNNLPDVICVGAQKAGTTTLADMFRKHPDVFVPEEKELHYFDQEDYKLDNIETYKKNFIGSSGYKIKAEFTPLYLYYKEIPERIFSALGQNVKILILLRHPVDRAFSQYLMNRRRGDDLLSFADTFYSEKERVRKNDFGRRKYSYFERGLYTSQVKRYLFLFPNVKVVFFDDFIKRNEAVMSEICQFCEITDVHIELLKSNEGSNVKSARFSRVIDMISQRITRIKFLKNSKQLKKIKEKMKFYNKIDEKSILEPTFAKQLQEYYYQDICELESLLKVDLTAWKNKYL